MDFEKKEKKFESPLEYELYEFLQRHLNKDFNFDIQYESKTEFGTYYLDMVCINERRKIGIECDGKEYHLDYNKDIWRDTLILSKGIVNSIFRVLLLCQ